MFIKAAVAASLAITSAHAADVIARFDAPLEGVKLQKVLASGFEVKEVLVKDMNIYLLRDLSKNSSAAASLNKAGLMEGIDKVMADQQLTFRGRSPSDPGFAQQYGMAKIEAPEAWTRGTGGQNGDREDVVVAVVDGGVDVNHEDLRGNMWVNAGETAGNGVDDDNNGYIDDVYGWNAYSNNANIPANGHGTHVAGIVGAEGDNGKHVAGVNWDVKIMGVAASSGQTSVVLKGYGYVLAQKKRWIASNGKEGANVVATNSSFGVDGADCTERDYGLWNDIYAEMGRHGILSAAATANVGWDVDKEGDVPTTCDTPYLIGVTNTDRNDKLNRGAAWGIKHVDLGAPGTDVYSTYPGNTSRNLTGTSMSTPHVAGAVAFLHSVASNRFTQLSKSNPGQAALELKNIMLSTVDKIPDLAGKSVSEGRLNLKKAAEAIANF